jgi:uncharacterized surface protein with fasciclin (FAS1) repeats
MTDLSGNGVTVTLPTGWEGRLFRRPAPGELQAQAADGPPAPEGATTNTVVHLATIPLPNGVGDFASGAVERLGDDDALIVVFEYDAASASQPLFAREGFPRVLEPGDFSPSVLQRTIRGQAGAQIFFHDGGRAFCLYVVLGGYNNRVKVVAAVNKVLATFSIDGGTVPASTNTVADVIAGRADLTVFSSLLTERGLVELLKSEPTVTVLAPVDSAFDPATLAELRADPARLERTLLHHFVRERLAPEVLRTRTTLMSAAGAEIAVTTSDNDAIAVDGVDLAPTPADGTNGVVYAIRGVLEPPP